MKSNQVAECYANHAEELTRFAATLVGPTHADDVLASALFGVLASSVVDVADMRSYLFRAVQNASKKHWRTLSRRERREALGPGSCAEVQPQQDCGLPRLLVILSPQQRAVVFLTYWADLSPSMTAARLRVSEGTVKRQLARAHRRLKEELDEHE